MTILFKDLGLPEKLFLKEMQALYEELLSAQSTGGLIQFFMDPSITNKVAYPAGSLGRSIKRKNDD